MSSQSNGGEMITSGNGTCGRKKKSVTIGTFETFASTPTDESVWHQSPLALEKPMTPPPPPILTSLDMNGDVKSEGAETIVNNNISPSSSSYNDDVWKRLSPHEVTLL